MAYGTGTQSKYSGNANRTTGTAAVTGTAKKKEAIFRTGLWKREGGKAFASVQLKEAVTLPAGTYVDIYLNDDKKSEQHPDVTLIANPGVVKAKK